MGLKYACSSGKIFAVAVHDVLIVSKSDTSWARVDYGIHNYIYLFTNKYLYIRSTKESMQNLNSNWDEIEGRFSVV